jgi:hypothetical protein
MKQHKKFASLVGLLSVLALAVLPAAAHAAGQPQLQLTANKSQVKVGQQVIVEVRVKDAPTVYGADVRLSFDPALLEVVDADPGTEGIQVRPGRFLNASQGFFLQHQVDNTAGTIDYALTLLNPAPPAQGNGVLVQVTFRARSSGRTTVSISEGLFGTQTGETIAPRLGSVGIEVRPRGGGGSGQASLSEKLQAFLGGTSDDTAGEMNGADSRAAANWVVIGGGAVLGLTGLAGIGVGGRLWLMNRARRR